MGRVVCGTMRSGDNSLRPGIAAVSARLENGTLRIPKGCCPNLLSEAELYRYDDATYAGPESPVGEHNHALDALRYLIHTLDSQRRPRPHTLTADDSSALPSAGSRPQWWRMIFDPAFEHLWTHIR